MRALLQEVRVLVDLARSLERDVYGGGDFPMGESVQLCDLPRSSISAEGAFRLQLAQASRSGAADAIVLIRDSLEGQGSAKVSDRLLILAGGQRHRGLNDAAIAYGIYASLRGITR